MHLSPKIADHPHRRVAWIDGLRILGALLIFLYHFLADYELFAGPVTLSGAAETLDAAWPQFAEWAISLFVMLAGLSLTLSWRPGVRVASYLKRRTTRLLLPLWIVAVPYMAAALMLGIMSAAELWKAPFWLLGLGIVSPQTYLPSSEAWWYVTLALQCALITPLVMWLLGRAGLGWTVCLLGMTSVASVWVISQAPSEWEYLVQGLVLARLVEFGVGVVAARVVCRKVGTVSALTFAMILLATAFLARGLGAITPVEVVAVWMAVLLGLSLALGSAPSSSDWLVLAGLATYPFYLAHAPIGKYTIKVLGGVGVDSPWALGAAALTISSLVAYGVVIAQRRITAILPTDLR